MPPKYIEFSPARLARFYRVKAESLATLTALGSICSAAAAVGGLLLAAGRGVLG
jgi:hypothetical protein